MMMMMVMIVIIMVMTIMTMMMLCDADDDDDDDDKVEEEEQENMFRRSAVKAVHVRSLQLSTYFQIYLVQSIGNKTSVLRSRWSEQSAKNKRERGDPARSSLRASSPSGEYREKQTHERHAREDAKARGGGFAARSRGSLLSPKQESLLKGQARSCLSSSGGSFSQPLSHSSKYILLSRKPVSLVLK